jgi:hypothetical protein
MKVVERARMYRAHISGRYQEALCSLTSHTVGFKSPSRVMEIIVTKQPTRTPLFQINQLESIQTQVDPELVGLLRYSYTHDRPGVDPEPSRSLADLVPT